MPQYDYKCKTCGKIFEYRQRITEDALTKCPKEVCTEEIKGQGEVHRIISKNVGLVFKGSGFYLTDYVHKNGSSSTPDKHNKQKAATTKPDTKKAIKE